MLRWPGRAEVLQALAAWAQRLELPGLVAVGAFGSYARGDAGVGSDLDIVVILETSELPFEREWEQLDNRSPRLAETLRRETVWVRGSD